MQYRLPRVPTPGSLLMLTLIFAPCGTQACTCMAFPKDLQKAVAMAYVHADVIFVGDITSVRNLRFRALPQREAHFVVRDRWKGSISDIAVVRTNIGEIACGYDFRKGNSYLVFAYWDNNHNVLTTSFCDLTRAESDAKDIIAILNRRRKT